MKGEEGEWRKEGRWEVTRLSMVAGISSTMSSAKAQNTVR